MNPAVNDQVNILETNAMELKARAIQRKNFKQGQVQMSNIDAR
jgi:hypothetical protein